MPKCAKGSLLLHVFLLLFLSLPAVQGRCQISLSSAIDRALENSLKIKAAQGDVNRAAAALAITKDIFIPSVVTGGGLGTAYGITLNVPTIFTINAQSLVYSAQQRFYIRAAHSDFKSAQLAFADARDQAEEDTAITYLSIVHAQKAIAAVTEQYNSALKLVSIVEDRVNGKLDSELELIKSRRTAVQLKLQKIRAENDALSLQEHLGQSIGLSADGVAVLPESIPEMPAPPSDTAAQPRLNESAGLLSAEANAQAKEQRAQGDSRYTWKPQVTFGAQYGRVSPIENVSEFYNLHGNYNTASVGLQIQLPMLDRVRKAAAQQATADAARTLNDLEGLRFDEEQGRRKLLRSLPELAAAAELAQLERQIAQSELSSTLVQMKQSGGGTPVTPKEEMNARIQERQKYLDYLDAGLQLQKAEISWLRQTGVLDKWLRSSPAHPLSAP